MDQYAEMMDETTKRPARFTSKEDRSAVLYNFYKMNDRWSQLVLAASAQLLQYAEGMPFLCVLSLAPPL